MNASVSHTHGLAQAGAPAELWTASPAAARNATALNLPVFRHPALAEPWSPLFRRDVWRRGRAAGRVDAVLHQGGKSWAWAWALWPTAIHAVRFPNYRIGDRRLFRNWIAVSTRHAERLRGEKTLGWLTPRIAAAKNGDAQSAARGRRARRAFRADGPLVIGALGMLNERKGQDVLIDALALLRERGVDAQVRLGGDGATGRFRAQAERLGVADHVAFLGWVDAVDFFAEIDLFCLPSRSEPFGIVVIEAMTQGVPVIASDVDGPADILADEAGRLVPPGDPTALAEAIAALADRPTEAVALGEAGRTRAATAYSPTAVGESLIAAFHLFGARRTSEARALAPSGDRTDG